MTDWIIFAIAIVALIPLVWLFIEWHKDLKYQDRKALESYRRLQELRDRYPQ